MGMPKTVKRLHKESNQDLIDDEVEAIDGYDRAIEGSDNPEAIATYEHIKGEEEEHIEELEGLDKMKADEITSEQAWEDFKAGYSDFEEKHIGKDREGDKASIEEKIDVLSAKISELNTDMSRLTDSVPQALGTIEEGKTLEQEAEEEQEGEELEGEMGDEEGGLFDDGEDDGLGDFFGDDETGEEGDADADGPDQALGDDGEPVEGGEEEVVDDEEITESDEDGETIDEGEEVVEDDADSDDDYIPIDDVMGDDEDSEEPSEESEEEESSEDDEEEKVIDKMVRILEKMDKRITILEHENAGLKKQLSQRMTVQTEPRNLAKSRPTPNTNLKLVKGSYNRPPVSTQYVANQRDIGIGKKKDSSENTSVFRQGLNEVFENCERIANQTRY